MAIPPPAQHDAGEETGLPAPFAAAVYVPRQPRGDALGEFVRELKALGVKVGGLLQEVVRNPDGSRDRIDTIDIATGNRVVINQTTPATLKSHLCSLDTAALAETTQVLRRAVADNARLIIVEKFGHQEAEGEGLAADILDVIASGVPMLVAVPETSFDAWQDRTGGLGVRLGFDLGAFRDWWAGIEGGY